LRDYLYIPLGGSRQGALKIAVNIITTFLLGGLWHGAGWGFVMWGGLHGAALVVFRIWNNFNIEMPKTLAWFVTFNFVNVTWVFFRAENWDKAMLILSAMVKPLSSIQQLDLIAVIAIITGLMIVTLFPNSNKLQYKEKVSWFETLCIGGFFFIAFTIYELRQSSEFLYFKF
jgi:D-alanyl-lipoteichoic acid acyltransferase DltB (MBOAT superfamily)